MKIKPTIGIAKCLAKYYISNKRTPITVSYLATNQCNQKCRYCDWTRTNQQQLNTAQAIQLIRELPANGVQKLGFAGGESLHRDDIAELLECSHKSGLFTSVCTNGRNVKKHINIIKKYVDIVQISFDGSEEIHDKLRGKGSYQIVCEAIHLLKKSGVKFVTNTVINKININDLQFVISKAEQNKYFALFQPVFYNDLSEVRSTIDILKPESRDMYNAINNLKRQKLSGKPVGNSISFLNYVQKSWNNKKIVKCYANKLFCVIDAMGYVQPCCFDSERNENYNAAHLGFQKAFKNSIANEFSAHCSGCYCCAYMESNLAFSLKLDACYNGLIIL
ncbi:MAG: Radical domain protein [Herbinix sp.]|jgi:MoaA/NifB/PqqE/SkfB family radical SAM enzyme|nr:Radical domain protein [Herbinix sp.]